MFDETPQLSNTSEQMQTLAEAAQEIQPLLKQLEETNPTTTEAEKKAFLTAAISPTRKERFLSAFKACGKAALEEFLDNSYINVALATAEGWQNPETFSASLENTAEFVTHNANQSHRDLFPDSMR